jgi:hypothetical protein
VNDSAPPAAAGQGVDPASPLDAMAADAETFFRSHGGRTLAAPDVPQYESKAPWIDPPSGFEAFYSPGIIATPAANGADTTALSFRVPTGYDGVIRRIANLYTGPGFVAGSGNLVWRILRNGQAIRNFDNMQFSLGTYSSTGGSILPAEMDGIRMFADDVITFIVNHAATSPLPVAGTQIVVLLGGWIYPKS